MALEDITQADEGPKEAMPPDSPSTTFAIDEPTLRDYLERCQQDFDTVPFNPVDSLVLSSLSYLNYDSYPYESVYTSQSISIIDVLRFGDFNELTRGSWMESTEGVEDMLFGALSQVQRPQDLLFQQ